MRLRNGSDAGSRGNPAYGAAVIQIAFEASSPPHTSISKTETLFAPTRNMLVMFTGPMENVLVHPWGR